MEKEYDDLTSTLKEQQEFEKGCLERLDILTKSPLMDKIVEGPHKNLYGPSKINLINIEKEFWESIKKAANESNWIPPEYYMNDWVNDICRFLRKGYTEFDKKINE